MTDPLRNPHPLNLAFAREYPGELAAYVAARGGDAVGEALDGLPADAAAAVVASLPHGLAVRMLAGYGDDRVGEWLNAASLNQALTLLLHVAEARRSDILDRVSDRRARRNLKRLAVYPGGTVGALVDPAAMRLNASLPLTDAVAVLQEDPPGPEKPIWLVDEAGIYLGLLDPNSVLASRSDRLKLSEFLVPVRALRAETALGAAREFDQWQTHAELPVVDELDHLLGSLSRRRLLSALAGAGVPERGLGEDVGALVRQYFRVMGVCLEELFALRGRKR